MNDYNSTRSDEKAISSEMQARERAGRLRVVVCKEMADDLMFPIMRLARTLALVILLPLGLAAFTASVTTTLVEYLFLLGGDPQGAMTLIDPSNFQNPITHAMALMFSVCPPVTAPLSVLISVALVALGLIAWTPYLMTTVKPGIGTKTCGQCGHAVPDRFMCVSCGEFRPAKLVSVFAFVLSATVTVINVVITGGLAAFAWLLGGGKV